MGNLSNEDIKQFLDVLFKRGFEKDAKKVINDAAKELVEKGRESDAKSISYEWQEPPHVFVPSQIRDISPSFSQSLVGEEGFVGYFYHDRDSNKPKKRWIKSEINTLKRGSLTEFKKITIGFGFTLNTFPELEKYFDRDMTITEAYEFLNYALKTIYVPKVTEATKGISLTQNQFDALVSIAYNKGQNFLLKDTKGIALIEFIHKGDIKSAADFIRSELDYKDTLKTAPGLRNRRATEAALFEK